MFSSTRPAEGILFLLGAVTLAPAASITTACYEETPSFFVWRFTWNGTATNGEQAFTPQNPASTACTATGTGSAAPVFWAVSVTPDFRADPTLPPTQAMTLKGQHKAAIHPPFEAPEGDPFSKTFSSVSPGPLGVTSTFKSIFVEKVDHLNRPVHFDVYSAIYKRPALESTTVQFSGEHVPEPSTLALLLAGLSGLLIGWIRRRRC